MQGLQIFLRDSYKKYSGERNERFTYKERRDDSFENIPGGSLLILLFLKTLQKVNGINDLNLWMILR